MVQPQPLSSMTGYARGSGVAAGASFSCEMKSVNARGLEIRLRLAPGVDALEGKLRQRIGAALSRGSVTAGITLERESGEGEIVVNERALGEVLAIMQRLQGSIEVQPPTLDGILALKGVIEQRQHVMTPEEEAELEAGVLACADRCLADLVAVRRGEGEQLRSVLLAHTDTIAQLTEAAEAHPSRSRDVIVARLREQVAELLAAGVGLSPDRLAQEALILATKADIREELDRLKAHIASARALIAGGGPVGRKLDFLAQELNREANTLCSKSNAVDLTAIGLDLKAAIDQLREQVQNVE
jgi:uncharacterized protein (TIGR00255 family)